VASALKPSADVAGVADSDIQEVATVLNSYRGGVRNK